MITGFVPLSIYVFSARSMNVPSDMQLAYQMLERQIRTGFIVDMRKDCSLSDAISCRIIIRKTTLIALNIV